MRLLASLLTVVALFVADQTIRVGIRVIPGGGTPGVLAASDFDYVGRKIQTDTLNFLGVTGGMTGRQVGGNTRLLMYSNFSTSSGVAPDLIEFDPESGGAWTTTGTPNRIAVDANFVNWGDVSHGVWDDTWKNSDIDTRLDCLSGASQCSPGGLYYDEATDLLHGGYFVVYTNFGWHSLWAATLDNPAGPTSTAYGVWRTTATTKGSSWTGATRGSVAHGISKHPTTGKMLTWGVFKSGVINVPGGPNLFEGDFPTTSTPSGQNSTEIPLTEYLYYYYPSLHSGSGAINGTLRSFLFPSGTTYIDEPGFEDMHRTDPANTPGYGGNWNVDSDSVYGTIWFEGTNKRGVIFTGKAAVGTSSTAADCTNAVHGLYQNLDQGSIKLASISGFSVSGVLTGGTSGMTGSTGWLGSDGDYIGYVNNLAGWSSGTTYVVDDKVKRLGKNYISILGGTNQDPATPSPTYWTEITSEFTVGETVTQTGTGASSTVVTAHKHDLCTHGCTLPIITGPTFNRFESFVAVFDPAKLEGIKANTLTDYQQEADWIKIAYDEWGLQRTCAGSGQAGELWGGYLTGTTLYLYSPATWPYIGNCALPEVMIHKFTINDSAPPPPTAPFLPLIGGAFVLIGGGLIRRRAA